MLALGVPATVVIPFTEDLVTGSSSVLSRTSSCIVIGYKGLSDKFIEI